MPGTLLTLERVAIAAATALTAVLFLPSLADPVNVVKLTALVFCAVVAGFLAALRVLRERVVRLPRDPTVYAAAALLAVLLLVTVTAPTLGTAVVGTYGRNSGLLAYAAALLLFFLGSRAWDAASTPILLLALLAGGLFTAAYGLLQYEGIDHFAWNNPFNPIIAGLGNPDFASAYVGLCVPVAAWGALWDRWALPWRVASGVAGVLCLLVALLSSAVQGPIAAAAGLLVIAAAWFMNRGGSTARAGLTTLGGLAVVGVATAVAGWAAHVGPLASSFTDNSGRARGWYWEGALTMLRHHPVLGVGLDHYGAYWRQVRPYAATRALGGQEFSDAAHSVPLQMLAEGGVLLGAAYLAFMGLVALSLVRGLRRLDGQARLVLGAVGGVWFAYAVQAAVSIDQVPLLTVNLVAAGAVVGLSASAVREIRLPGALRPAAETATKRRVPALPREREWTGADTGFATAVAVGCLVVLWFALLPLRASAATHTGDVALANRNGNAALAAFQKANRLQPGVGLYWQKTANLYQAVRLPSLALQTYVRGADADPFDVSLLMAGARLAATQKDDALQARLLHRAAAIDPTNPLTALEVAAFDAGHGDLAAAGRELDRALAALPQHADMWAARGQVYAAAKDPAGARAAYQRAVALQADNPVAKHGLAVLDAKP